MGLIRSGYTTLTPEDDEQMTDLLWPIVREMIKTAIENKQNMIIEGCYIPYDWEKDFNAEYRACIKYICLVMSEHYVENKWSDIKQYASLVEQKINSANSLFGVIKEKTR